MIPRIQNLTNFQYKMQETKRKSRSGQKNLELNGEVGVAIVAVDRAVAGGLGLDAAEPDRRRRTLAELRMP